MSRGWGIPIAVLSAVCYGASLPLSRLGYDHGTNALTILTLRYLTIIVVLGVWLGLTGSTFRMAPRMILACAAVGVCFVAVSGGLLASVNFIPVNLTVVVFYTYPVLTLLVVSATDRAQVEALLAEALERFGRLDALANVAGILRTATIAELSAVVLALLGVAFAMQVSFEHLNAEGVGFALLAGVGVAGSFIVSVRILPHVGTTRMTWYACSLAFLAGVVMTAGFDALALPSTGFGIGLVAAVVSMFAVAVVSMFVAVRLVGPVRLATFLCLEPLTAILVAVLALGESLKGGQWVGIALVGLALLIASRQGAPPDVPTDVPRDVPRDVKPR